MFLRFVTKLVYSERTDEISTPKTALALLRRAVNITPVLPCLFTPALGTTEITQKHAELENVQKYKTKDETDEDETD